MSRVAIEDLEEETEISDEEMKAVFGGINIGARYEPGQRQAPSDKPDWTKGSHGSGLSASPGERRSRERADVPEAGEPPAPIFK